MSNNNPGCLGSLLQVFGLIPKEVNQSDDNISSTKESLPYALRDDFLSAAELSFYKVLQQVVGGKALICTKVSLKDLFFAKTNDRSAKTSYNNYIARKHVDFVLCTVDSVKPICGIELDDSSHQRKDRVERDNFVEKVFESAKLPLIRFQNKRSYTINEINEKLSLVFQLSESGVDEGNNNSTSEVAVTVESHPVDLNDNLPICKKCGIPMVLRVSTRGENKGQSFYGCSNYPKCRETIRNVGDN